MSVLMRGQSSAGALAKVHTPTPRTVFSTPSLIPRRGPAADTQENTIQETAHPHLSSPFPNSSITLANDTVGLTARAPAPTSPTSTSPTSTSPTSTSPLIDLPIDVLVRVATHLFPRDIHALAAVATRFTPLANDTVLWTALELRHFPVTQDSSPSSSPSSSPPPHHAPHHQVPSNPLTTATTLAPGPARFHHLADTARGHWHIATGTIVHDLPVHMRSGIFVVVRPHGGTEKPVASPSSSLRSPSFALAPNRGDCAAYVMNAPPALAHPSHHNTHHPRHPPSIVVSTSRPSNRSATLPPASQHTNPNNPCPVLHQQTAHPCHTPSFSPSRKYYRHRPNSHRYAYANNHLPTTPNTQQQMLQDASPVHEPPALSPEFAPAVELEFKVGANGVPFPTAGLLLRLVHAVQTEIGSPPQDALDAVRISVIVNGHVVEPALALSENALNRFVHYDITIGSHLLHDNGLVNTLVVRYGGHGGYAYWLRDVYIAPFVVGLGKFDDTVDGGSLPTVVPSGRNKSLRYTHKHTSAFSHNRSPTHISGWY